MYAKYGVRLTVARRPSPSLVVAARWCAFKYAANVKNLLVPPPSFPFCERANILLLVILC